MIQIRCWNLNCCDEINLNMPNFNWQVWNWSKKIKNISSLLKKTFKNGQKIKNLIKLDHFWSNLTICAGFRSFSMDFDHVLTFSSTFNWILLENGQNPLKIHQKRLKIISNNTVLTLKSELSLNCHPILNHPRIPNCLRLSLLLYIL